MITIHIYYRPLEVEESVTRNTTSTGTDVLGRPVFVRPGQAPGSSHNFTDLQLLRCPGLTDSRLATQERTPKGVTSRNYYSPRRSVS